MSNGLTRELIAARVAKELREGMYVNLGIGIPTLVSLFITEGQEVVLQSENGVLGYGPIADEEEKDIDLVNAGGQPVTLLSGASFFHSADSFAMIRGGHIDVTVLGAFQVSEKGDLANWKTPDEALGTMGGAIDLAIGAKRLLVAMEHVDKQGNPRIVKQCTYPITARQVVDTIFTNLAVIEVTAQGLLLREVAPGTSPDEVKAVTEPKLIVASDIREMAL